MEDRLIHGLSLKLCAKLNQYAEREGNDYLKLVYGMEVIILNISKLVILAAIAMALGVLPYAIAALIGFNVLRRSSFGLHATNSTVCTVITCTLFVAAPYVITAIHFEMGRPVVLLMFAIILLAIFRYAPADTEKRPLPGAKNRAKIRKKAIISGVVLAVFTLLIPHGGLRTMLTIGAVYEALLILPVTYKIFGQKYQNYIDFEKKHAVGKAA